jgi:hypothetical protein
VAAATHNPLPKRAQRPGFDHVADAVVIGDSSYTLSDVVSYDIEAREDLDNEGQILCSTIYGIALAALLIGTAIGGFDGKLMLAVMFIGAIALMCLADARAVKPVTVYRLIMQMSDGQRAVFTAGEWEQVAAIADRIDVLASNIRGYAGPDFMRSSLA